MIEFYIKKKNTIIATGHFKDEDWSSKTFILHKGSTITPLAKRLKNINKGAWIRLKELNTDGSIQNGTLSKDVEFRSTSEAGMFVIGRECQGPEMFKDINEKSINKYLENLESKPIFINNINLPVSIFSLDKILNDRIVIKSKINEENIDTTDAYIAKDFDELLRTTGRFININYTSLNIGKKLVKGLPKKIWENPEIYKMKFLDISGDSGFLERYLVKKLVSNKYMKQQFPDYGQRVFHILHNMIYAIAKTNATSLWLRKAVYYSADTRITGYKTEGNRRIDTGDYPTIFNGNLFSRGKDFNKLDSYKINGNIKSPYIEDVIGQDQIFNYPLLDWVNSGKNILEYVSILFWDLFTDKKYIANPDEKQKERQDEIMEEIKKTLNGYFDVIMGNPPYNTNDEKTGKVGNTVYQLFCQAAEALNPKYTSFIIPSKWMYGKANGKNMTEFSQSNLSGNNLTYLELIDGKLAFPSVSTGEVCIYTKELNRVKTETKVEFIESGIKKELKNIFEITHKNSKGKKLYKPYNSIVNKVHAKITKSLAEDTNSLVYKNNYVYDEYGHDILDSSVAFKYDYEAAKGKLINFPDGTKGARPTLDYSLVKTTKFSKKLYIPRVKLYKGDYPSQEDDKKISHIWINPDIIKDYKGNIFSHNILAVPPRYDYHKFLLDYPYNAFIVKPDEVAPAMYAIGKSLNTNIEVENLKKYMQTKFATYLIYIASVGQNFNSDSLLYVPYMDFTQEWDDDKLNKFFNLSEEEIKTINETWNKFKPMKGESIDYMDIEDDEQGEDIDE